eukprot:5298538-Pyramimonas_sp.AAC.1
MQWGGRRGFGESDPQPGEATDRRPLVRTHLQQGGHLDGDLSSDNDHVEFSTATLKAFRVNQSIFFIAPRGSTLEAERVTRQRVEPFVRLDDDE